MIDREVPSKSQFRGLCGAMLLLTAGQVLLSQGRAFVMAQRPIDWAHWLLLLGAVSVAGVVAYLTVGPLGRIGRFFVMAGAVAFIGMCTIDFLMWSLPSDAARQNLFNEGVRAPVIAIPFLQVGPSLLFAGLALMAIEWRGFQPLTTLLFTGGIMVSGYGQFGGQRWIVALGHLLMLAALVIFWLRRDVNRINATTQTTTVPSSRGNRFDQA